MAQNMSRARTTPSRYGSKEERNLYEKQLRERNTEFAERQRQNCREWVKKFPEKKNYYDWSFHIKQKYGLTAQDYDQMLLLQGGGCKLCGHKAVKNRLPVDHDHTTGRVRGILCTPCNRAVGIVERNVHKLVDYLKEPSQCCTTADDIHTKEKAPKDHS